jgi:hypothetical protein
MTMAEREQDEPREVRVADPSLSPEANRILTEELRQVVGGDTVRVPAGRKHVERERHGARSGFVVGLASNRLALGIAFLVALVVGAILSLVTDSWWFLLLALGVLALATIAVVLGVVQLTTETEHLSPSAAARLEDEGVGDPDALFSALVEEFTPRTQDDDESGGELHGDSKPVGP